jgi:hypothetical protein
MRAGLPVVVAGFAVVGVALALAPRVQAPDAPVVLRPGRTTSTAVLPNGLTVFAVEDPSATGITATLALRGSAPSLEQRAWNTEDPLVTTHSGVMPASDLEGWLAARLQDLRDAGDADAERLGPSNALLVVVSSLSPDSALSVATTLDLERWAGPAAPTSPSHFAPSLRPRKAPAQFTLGYQVGPRDPAGEAALLVVAEALRPPGERGPANVRVRALPSGVWFETHGWCFDPEREQCLVRETARVRAIADGAFDLADAKARALVVRQQALQDPEARAHAAVNAWLRDLPLEAVDDVTAAIVDVVAAEVAADARALLDTPPIVLDTKREARSTDLPAVMANPELTLAGHVLALHAPVDDWFHAELVWPVGWRDEPRLCSAVHLLDQHPPPLPPGVRVRSQACSWTEVSLTLDGPATEARASLDALRTAFARGQLPGPWLGEDQAPVLDELTVLRLWDPALQPPPDRGHTGQAELTAAVRLLAGPWSRVAYYGPARAPEVLGWLPPAAPAAAWPHPSRPEQSELHLGVGRDELFVVRVGESYVPDEDGRYDDWERALREGLARRLSKREVADVDVRRSRPGAPVVTVIHLARASDEAEQAVREVLADPTLAPAWSSRGAASWKSVLSRAADRWSRGAPVTEPEPTSAEALQGMAAVEATRPWRMYRMRFGDAPAPVLPGVTVIDHR